MRSRLREVNIAADLENEYHSLVMKAVKGKTMPKEGPKIKVPSDWEMTRVDGDREVGVKDRPISEDALKELKNAWDTTGRKTPGDWKEWMRRFSLELLRQSPSPIIHICKNLAQQHRLWRLLGGLPDKDQVPRECSF